MMTHLGLFEGIGGFSLAARWMGWKTLAWCEWNEFGQRVLRHHFPNAEGFGDITKTDFTKYANRIDILTGGFPCQPYSMAGKRLGKEDDRHLWPEMLRAIREIQPRWVVGENVLGLVNWNGGLVFDEVQADLEAQGYEVQPYVLPACAVNAPHRRDRVWFVAYASSNRRKWQRQRTSPEEGLQSQSTRAWELEGRLEGLRIQNDASDTDSKVLEYRDREGEAGKRTIAKERIKSFAGARDWSAFPTKSPICSRDDGFPSGLDGITFSKWRNESIKAAGNAVVPQIPFIIFKAIEQYEQS
jgi:DNA (cytosine-5)-methyltransferase 1